MKTIKRLKKRKSLKRRKYNGGAAAQEKSGSGKKKFMNLEGHPLEKHNGLAQRILGLIVESSLNTRNELFRDANRYASYITDVMANELTDIFKRHRGSEKHDHLQSDILAALKKYDIMPGGRYLSEYKKESWNQSSYYRP